MSSKSLSLKQAQRCEDAQEPACRCRCGGLMHGKKRAGESATAAFFATLPEDDPHYVPTKEQRAEKRKAAQDEKRRARQERIDAAWNAMNDLRIQMFEAQRDGRDQEARELTQRFLAARVHHDAISKQK